VLGFAVVDCLATASNGLGGSDIKSCMSSSRPASADLELRDVEDGLTTDSAGSKRD
jgi:hypothetical protein